MMSVEVKATETSPLGGGLSMATAKEQRLESLKKAIGNIPRGKWYSPDTTAKKDTWYVSVAYGQAVGMPIEGDYVWVAKSRGAFQLVEVTTQEGEHVDKEGLKRVLFNCKVVNEL